jgi:hypothetical protein
MMSDFTKEELEHIYEIFNEVIEKWKEPITTSELKDKILSMIDNYCEHENYADYTGKAEYPHKCSNCDAWLRYE